MNWGIWLLSLLMTTSAFAIRNGVSGRFFKESRYLAEIDIERTRGAVGKCTGIRIHQDYVLTVAHCFSDVPDSTKFSLKYKNSWGRRRSRQVHVNEVIILSTKLHKELALIPLKNTRDSFIAPDIYQDEFSLSQIRFFGFGMNTSGNFTGLRSATLGLKIENQTEPNGLIVASPGAGNAHPCPGDSGGPLFKEVDGEMKVWGLITYVNDSEGKLNSENADHVKVCKKADRSYFIPLHSHMDFLNTYFEVATNLAENETNP